MAAEKRHPENDPLDSALIEDLTERVFKDYQPPKLKDFVLEDGDEAEESRPAA
jgi:hypothetical protein